MLKYWIVLIGLLTIFSNGFCWNKTGHQLVAQIAYHNLNNQTRDLLNRYNHVLDKAYGAYSLITVAPWLDSLRYRDKLWLQPMHYINIPFSTDGTELIPPKKMNVIVAVKQAANTLSSDQSSLYDKSFSLRILMHIVGDIHQPMHAVTEYSKRLPQGDKGGNLVHLAKNPVGQNLHAYWDNGGGFLQKSYSASYLNKKAYKIENHYPCDLNSASLNPEKWAEESHKIAIKKAYLLKSGQKPGKAYQRMVKRISEKRIAIAGCRLAALFNHITSIT